VDGIALAEAQRRTLIVPVGSTAKVYGIGGFLQLTTITSEAVSSRVIHRWPEDKIGQRIVPIGSATETAEAMPVHFVSEAV
jgi:hypothetical protein